MKNVILLMAMYLGLFACGNGNAKGNKATEEQSKKDRVEVLYFHGKQRCATCMAIEKHAKEAIEMTFADELKNGTVVFKSIDISKAENEKIAEKYEVVRALKSCLDVVKESDYIRSPKESGYRSYHMIVVVPVHYLKGIEYYPVELQIRTLTMDCWASIEHQLHYKTLKDEFYGEISKKFQQYSEELNMISLKMEAIYAQQNTRLPMPTEFKEDS